MKRNILIDANNLFHRSHAIYVKDKSEESLLTNSRGYPTGFIYGVYSMLSDWIDDISNPTRIIFFMDGVPKRRLEIDSSYKQKKEDKAEPGRLDAPLKLCDGFQAINEIDIVFHLGSKLGIDTYYNAYEEADDLIASFISDNRDDVNIVISSDKDFYQLLNKYPTMVLYRPGVSGNRLFDAERAADHMEQLTKARISADDIIMFKALTGDPSDGISGVPRLRKKVIAPLCKYQTVEELLESGLPGFSKKEKANTLSMVERIATNLRLIRLNESIEIGAYLKKADPDFSIASKILHEDLEIRAVNMNSFKTISSRTIRTSAPSLPDWLSDI